MKDSRPVAGAPGRVGCADVASAVRTSARTSRLAPDSRRVLLAANYCPAAEELVRSGRVGVDLFKCPAWPELVEAAGAVRPTYVHFPLMVGRGIGTADDSESGQPVDWAGVDSFLAATETPLVNLHLATPDVLAGDVVSRPSREVIDRLVADVAGVVDRFGARRVVLENDYESMRGRSNAGLLPETFRTVLDETGAGLLLDLAHAQIAARRLSMDVRRYVELLPVARLREVHVSGVRRLRPTFSRALRHAGVDEGEIDGFLSRSFRGLCDHLPLSNADWDLVEWTLARIERGDWRRPWAVSLEYGGVGPWFAPVTERHTLGHHLTRLGAQVHRI